LIATASAPPNTGQRPCRDADLTLEAHVRRALDDRMPGLLPCHQASLEDARAEPGEFRGSQPCTRAGPADEHELTISRQLVPAPRDLVQRKEPARFEMPRVVLRG
jgi:hypothetical protein